MPERSLRAQDRNFIQRNLLDRFWPQEAPVLVEQTPEIYPESPVGQLQERLLNAGFQKSEIEENLTPAYRDSLYSEWEWVEEMNNSSLKLLHEISDGKPSRKMVIAVLQNKEVGYGYALSSALNEVSGEREDSEEIRANLTSLVEGNLSKAEFEDVDDKNFGYAMRLYAAVCSVTNKEVFGLYGRDTNVLGDYLINYEKRRGLGSYTSKVAKLSESANTEILLEGFDYHIIEKLPKNLLEIMLTSPESARLFNEYLKSDQGWADKIRMFKKVFLHKGLEVKEGIETNPEVMSRIAKEEDPKNPWVSMGLGTSVGWEIEYPDNTPVVFKIKHNNIYSLLDSIGFKKGGGASGLEEASPGPFNSYETGNAIFQLYEDAGVIDTKANLGMNCHFNVGRLKGDWGLVSLVRALYLTGAAYDPHERTQWPRLYITPNWNEDNRDKYFEGKVFDVTTSKDWQWNFKSASVLSSALKAFQEIDDDTSGNVYRAELASIWQEYMAKMGEGMDFLWRKDYLTENRNVDDEERVLEDVEWVDKQLSKIWSDPNYYRIPNLKVVGQKNPAEANSDGIQGLQAGDKWYPNIANFAREVTDSAVSRILDVKRRVEENCVKDIKRIDALHGYRRKRGISRFIRYYGVKVEGDTEDFELQEKAFQEMKDYMIPVESAENINK